MANNFVFSPKSKRSAKQIKLTYHSPESQSSEYYTYEFNGAEHKYTNSFISKDGNTYIGKLVHSTTIPLTFVPAVEHIDYVPCKFTYVLNGETCIYTGKPEYDADTYSYYFVESTMDYVDERVTLICED